MTSPLPHTTETRGGKTERAMQMLASYRRGRSVIEIARDFGVTQRCVHLRLNELGVEFDRGRPDDLWSLPEEDRRSQITLRAARGAREALKQIRPVSPLSTEFTGRPQAALTPVTLEQDSSC